MVHHLGEPVRLVWGPEHVHMVRPQHIGMDDTVIGHCSSVQTLQVHLIIIRMKEDRLAIVPALDDVLRHVDQGIARGARHRRPQNEGPQRYISSRLEIKYPNRLYGVMIFLWHNTTL